MGQCNGLLTLFNVLEKDRAYIIFFLDLFGTYFNVKVFISLQHPETIKQLKTQTNFFFLNQRGPLDTGH